jgi:putative hemolysin
MQAQCLSRTAKFLQDSRRYLFGTEAGSIEVRLAQDQYEIIEAQKLRHRVFSTEFGSQIYSDQQRDIDDFDPYCQHLIAIESGQIVGTYRILFPEGAARAGRMYSETEFDLTNFGSLRQSTIELGRSCIAPEFRNGDVLRRLWTGLGDLLSTRAEKYLMGCVSVSMEDGGYFAASLYQHLRRLHPKSPATLSQFRVSPMRALPISATADSCQVVVPPLMKSYLKLGARLIGEPHWDVDFRVADFPMMMEGSLLEKRFSSAQLPRPRSERYPDRPLSNLQRTTTATAPLPTPAY